MVNVFCLVFAGFWTLLSTVTSIANIMADPNQLINDGMVFASQAIQHDQNGAHQLAHFFYVEASEAILKAISLDTNLSSAKSKALQYVARAEVLQSLARSKVLFM